MLPCQVALAHDSRAGEWIKSLCSPGVWSEFIFISILFASICTHDCAHCACVCPVYGSTTWQTNVTAFYCFAWVVCSFFLWILLKIYKGEYDRSCAWIIINLGGLIICRNQHLRGLPLSRYRKSLIFGNYHLDVGSLRPNFYHVIL